MASQDMLSIIINAELSETSKDNIQKDLEEISKKTKFSVDSGEFSADFSKTIQKMEKEIKGLKKALEDALSGNTKGGKGNKATEEAINGLEKYQKEIKKAQKELTELMKTADKYDKQGKKVTTKKGNQYTSVTEIDKNGEKQSVEIVKNYQKVTDLQEKVVKQTQKMSKVSKDEADKVLDMYQKLSDMDLGSSKFLAQMKKADTALDKLIDKENALVKAEKSKTDWIRKANVLRQKGVLGKGDLGSLEKQIDGLSKVTGMDKYAEKIETINKKYDELIAKQAKLNAKNNAVSKVEKDVKKSQNTSNSLEFLNKADIKDAKDQAKQVASALKAEIKAIGIDDADYISKIEKAKEKYLDTLKQIELKTKQLNNQRKAEVGRENNSKSSLDKIYFKTRDSKNKVDNSILNDTQKNQLKGEFDSLVDAMEQELDKLNHKSKDFPKKLKEIEQSYIHAIQGVEAKLKKAQADAKVAEKDGKNKPFQSDNLVEKMSKTQYKYGRDLVDYEHVKKLDDMLMDIRSEMDKYKKENGGLTDKNIEKLEKEILAVQRLAKEYKEYEKNLSTQERSEKSAKKARVNQKNKVGEEFNDKLDDSFRKERNLALSDKERVEFEQARQKLKQSFENEFQQLDTEAQDFSETLKELKKDYADLIKDADDYAKRVSDERINEAKRMAKEAGKAQNQKTKPVPDAKVPDFKKEFEKLQYSYSRKLTDNSHVESLDKELKEMTEKVESFAKTNSKMSEADIELMQKRFLHLQRLAKEYGEVESARKKSEVRTTRLGNDTGVQIRDNDFDNADGKMYQRMEEKIQDYARSVQKAEAENVRLTRTFDANGNEMIKYSYIIAGADGKLKTISGTIDRTSQSMRELSETSQHHMTMLDNFATALQKVPIWAGVSSLFFSSITGIEAGVQAIYEMDKAMTDLKKVADETSQEFAEFQKDASAIGQELGSTATDVIKATTEFSRLGYSLNEAKGMARQSIVYANVGDMGVDESTSALTSSLKGFAVAQKDVVSESRKYVDIFNEVGNNYAVSSAGIGEALMRSSATMHEAGNSVEETVALIASANAPIQNEKRVGNGLKTISMRLRGIKEEGDSAIPALEEKFNKLGITIMNANGGMKSTYQIFEELAKVWGTLPDMTRADLLEAIGGKQHGVIVSAILNNWTDASGAYEDALNSAGSATKEYEKYMDSIQYKVGQLQNSFEHMWTTAINTETIKLVIDLLNGLIKVMTTSIDKLGLGATVVGVFLNAMLFMNKASRDAILQGNALAGSYQAVALGAQKAGGAIRTLFSFLGRTFIATALLTGVVAIIEKSVAYVTKENAERKKRLQYLQEEYDQTKQTLDMLQNSDNQSMSKMASVEVEVETGLDAEGNELDDGVIESKRQELLNWKVQLAETMPEVIQYYDSEGQAVYKNIDAIQALVQEYRKLNAENAKRLAEGKLEEGKSGWLGTGFRDYFSQLEKVKEKTKEAQKEFNDNSSSLSGVKYMNNFIANNIKGLEANSPEMDKALDKMKANLKKKLGSGYDEFYEEYMQSYMKPLEYGNAEAVLKMSSAVEKTLENGTQTVKNKVETAKADLQDAQKEFNEVIDAFEVSINEQFSNGDPNKTKFISMFTDAYQEGLAQTKKAPEEYAEAYEGAMQKIMKASKKKGIDFQDVFAGDKDAIKALNGLKNTKGIKDNADAVRILNTVLKELKISMVDVKQESFDLASAQADLNDSVKEYLNNAQSLSDTYFDLIDGKNLSIEQIYEMITQYPELIKHLKQENGFLTLNAEGVEKLQKLQQEQFKLNMEMKKREMEAEAKSVENALEATLKKAKAQDFLNKARQKGIEVALQEAKVNYLSKYDNEDIRDNGYKIYSKWNDMAKKLREGYEDYAGIEDIIGSIDALLDQDLSGLSNALTGGATGGETSEAEKAMETFTYVADKYKQALEDVNARLEKQRDLMGKIPKGSAEYRKALQQEIKLLQEKAKILKEQETNLQSQINSGKITQYGVVSTGFVSPSQTTSTSASSYTGGNLSGWGVVTSPFGGRYDDPSDKHDGIDIRAKQGTSLQSNVSGTVVWANPNSPSGTGYGGYGGAVAIKDSSGKVHLYGHLSQIGTKLGEVVNIGDTIGKTGGKKGAYGSGHSQAEHLHYEVRENGKAIDPSAWLPTTSRTTGGRAYVVGAGKSSGLAVGSLFGGSAPAVANPTMKTGYSGKYADIINEASQKYGVDPFLIASMIQQESKFNPNAKSGAGAKGLMQLMPDTAKEMGVKNAYDPFQNIMGGTRYISERLKKWDGDIQKALYGYNAGDGNVDNVLASGANKWKEPKGYYKNVMGYYQQFTGGNYTANAGAVVPNTPTLKKGASGEAVSNLQKLLGVEITGMFDQATENAVKVFQKEKGIKVDGIVGKYTWGLLGNGMGADSGTNPSRDQAEAKQAVDQARLEVINLKQQQSDVADEIQELQFAITQDFIDGYERLKDRVSDELSESQLRAEEQQQAGNQFGYRKELKEQLKLLDDKKKYQQSMIRFMYEEAEANKNLTNAQRQQLYDSIRQKEIELHGMAREVKDLIASVNQSKFDYVFDQLETRYENLGKVIKKVSNAGKMIDEEDVQKQIHNQKEYIALLEQQRRQAKYNINRYTQLSNELDKTSEAYKQSQAEIEKWKETLNDTDVEIVQASKSLKDMYNDIADDVIDIYKDYYEKKKEQELEALEESKKAVEKEHEMKMEALDEELKAYEKLINKKLESLQTEEDEHDFEREMEQKQKDLRELEKKRNTFAMDSSLGAQQKVAELEKEIADKKDEIAEFSRDRQVQLQQEALQKALEAKQEEIEAEKENAKFKTELGEGTMEEINDMYDEHREKVEDTYENLMNDERRFAEIRKQILAGNFKDITDDMGNSMETIKNFIETNMQSIGQSISENMIDKLNEAKKAMDGLEGMSDSPSTSAPTTFSEADYQLLAGKYLSDLAGKAQDPTLKAELLKQSQLYGMNGRSNGSTLDPYNDQSYNDILAKLTGDQKVNFAKYLNGTVTDSMIYDYPESLIREYSHKLADQGRSEGSSIGKTDPISDLGNQDYQDNKPANKLNVEDFKLMGAKYLREKVMPNLTNADNKSWLDDETKRLATEARQSGSTLDIDKDRGFDDIYSALSPNERLLIYKWLADSFVPTIPTGVQNYRSMKDYISTAVHGRADYVRSNGATLPKNGGFEDMFYNSYLKFDTGGYTGDGEGLAYLHEKELVLNKMDTKNILDVVSIVDRLTGLLPKLLSGKFTMPSGTNASTGGDTHVYVDIDIAEVTGGKEGAQDMLNRFNNALKKKGVRV